MHRYFKNRQIDYSPETKLGDIVTIYPDSMVITSNPFEDAALGVTPIHITLSNKCYAPSSVPDGAFYMKCPDGVILYGASWYSGNTHFQPK